MTNLTVIKSDEQFEALLDGNLIGEGQSRGVYSLDLCGYPGLVMKKQKGPWPCANITEWIIWEAVNRMARGDTLGHVPDFSFKELFAECFAISTTGR